MMASYPSFADLIVLFPIFFVTSTSSVSAFFAPNTSWLNPSVQRFHRRTKYCHYRYHGSSVFRSHNDEGIQNHRDVLLHHDHVDNKNKKDHHTKSRGRRAFFQGMLTPILLLAPEKSNAQFVKFPCVNGFGNTYHFLRAGESLMEEEGVWTTNPLFLTNRESALSRTGIEQVELTCKTLEEDGVVPTIVRYSLAANAIDTSNTVGRRLGVGRDRLVPEFNFMDPRAIGMWDMSLKNTTEAAVWALDATEAGEYGMEGRPPANIDGTPHETLADQTVRLRQLLSVLETQYSGDTILLIFPDGTGPALLTCLIGGIPLYRVHEFEFQPGEVRLDISYNSARALVDKKPSDGYLERLEEGKRQLTRLLENPEDSMLDVRDRQYERERELEQEKKIELEREKTSRLEEEARVKKDKQLAEMEQRKKADLEIKMKREAQLTELKNQKEAEIAKMKEKERENKIKKVEISRQRETESRERAAKANAEREEEAREKLAEKNALIAEAARRKEIEKEYKTSKNAQLAEINRQKSVNNEPGELDLLVGGGALIGAGGAAYLFLQEEENSEREPGDDGRGIDNLEEDGIDPDGRAEMEGQASVAVEGKAATDLARNLKAEEEKVRRAEENARKKAKEEEARAAAEAERLRAEEQARILAAKEEARAAAAEVEEAKIKAEEEAKTKAEEEAKLKVEEETKRMAEEEAKLKSEEEEAARILRAEEDARWEAEEVAAVAVAEEAARLEKMTKRERMTWNPDEDDGGVAWLDSLAEMMNDEAENDKDDDENDGTSKKSETWQ